MNQPLFKLGEVVIIEDREECDVYEQGIIISAYLSIDGDEDGLDEGIEANWCYRILLKEYHEGEKVIETIKVLYEGDIRLIKID